MKEVFFFCGVDPAPSEGHRSDDGAVVAAAATMRSEGKTWSDNPADWFFDYVYGRRFTSKQKLSARAWSGFLHGLHRAFGFTRIGLDPGGGGTYVQRELKAAKQIIHGNEETEVTPIADLESGPLELVRADFILHMIKRGDPGIEALWPRMAGDENLNDAVYSEMKEATETAGCAWPAPAEEWKQDKAQQAIYAQWSQERQWALENMDRMIEQMTGIAVAVKEDGVTPIISRRGARLFASSGKKDFVSAGMNARVAFVAWLRMGAGETVIAEEDQGGMSGW